MRELKIIFWLHVTLGPIGAWICADDWSHPERWGDWFCNPAYAKPALVILEIFIWSGVAWCLWRERKDKRMAAGVRRLQEAMRLLKKGRIAEADAAYREGKRLTGC